MIVIIDLSHLRINVEDDVSFSLSIFAQNEFAFQK